MAASNPVLDIGHVVRLVFAECDQEYARLREEADAEGFPPTVCSKGCAACCTYVVNVVEQEAVLLAQAVQVMPTEQRQQTIGRLEAWRRLWRNHVDGRERGGIHGAAVAWGARRIPCPLLNLTTHTCSVYPDRPHACRMHHACQLPDPMPTEHDDLGSCDRCQPRPPGEGCFATPQDVGHGHHPIVWQVRSDLQDVAFRGMCKALSANGVSRTSLGLLPMMVLQQGAALFNWPRRPKPVKLHPMTSSYPRRGT